MAKKAKEPDADGSGKLRLRNVSMRPRIIHDMEGKAVIVPVGGAVVIHVGERQERDLRRDATMAVEYTDDEVHTKFTETDLATPIVPKKDTKVVDEVKFSAQQLLDKGDDVDYHTFAAYARDTLGDDFPDGSQPRKALIVKALRARAKQEAEKKE